MAKIFLLEDSPALRRVLVRQIRDAGHTVAAFGNGEQSGNRGIVGDADVLITDLSMPGVDGEAAIRAVSRLRPNLPIIVISGAPPAHIATMKAVDMVLHKPFSEAKLVEAIAAVLQTRNTRLPMKESHNASRFRERPKRKATSTALPRSWFSIVFGRLSGGKQRKQMF